MTADAPDASLPSASVERVAASSAKTVSVPVGTVPSQATIDVSYSVGGESSSSSNTVSAESLQTNTVSAAGQEAFLGGGMGGFPLAGLGLLFGGVVVGVAGTRLRT